MKVDPHAEARPLTRPRTHGFTLIELLLAMAILVTVTLIAVPAYSSYVERTRVAQAETDIIGIGAQIASYYEDEHAYPPSLAAIGDAGMLDPWKRLYVYLPLNTPSAIGKARKDKNLVPINSDFDLYSVGPDGLTAPPITAPQSQDDVIRADNGAFVGVASDYNR